MAEDDGYEAAATVDEEVKSAPAEQPQQDNAPKASDIFMLARQQNFSVATKLLDAYPRLWKERDDDGHSLLHWAALVGAKDMVILALANGVPVDCQANNLQTPLMWAVLRGHTHTARVLLENNADMRIKDSLGATALIISIQHACYGSMLLLLHRGDKASLMAESDKNGCTSAHWAAYKGDLTALRLLEYFKADLLTFDNQSMQPIHRAVFGSQVQVVEFLVERKADTMHRNADGKNCIDIAESQGDLGMQALFKRLAKNKKLDNSIAIKDESSSSSAKGKKGGFAESMQNAIQKDKSMQKIFPCFWLVMVSLASFQYLMDLRATSYSVAPIVSMLFEIGVPFTLAIFAYTALMDPGKVAPKTPGNSGVEEIMKALDSPDEHVVDMSRLCTTTWVLKGLRSKYCTQTGAVIEEFDHYCIWLNCAIGKNNHRPFILLAIAECLTQVCHIYLCWSMAKELVTVPGFGSWIFGVCTGYPLLAIVFIVHCITAPWVFMLFLHQSRLVATNLTTNEMMNAGRYEHFWTHVTTVPGRMQKSYRNPFNKGGMLKNCLDFWWLRNRRSFGPSDVINAAASCQKQCCNHSHGHSHGHDNV